jgi:WD40 repeat protein
VWLDLFDPQKRHGRYAALTGPQNMVVAPQGQIVGVTPDGATLVAAEREYNLVSGRHRLHVWDFKSFGTAGGPPPPKTVDLDADDTFDFAFAADGKTFRTVAIDFDKATQRFRKLAVKTVDMATGKTLKTLMTAEGPFARYAFARNGKRLGVVSFAKDAKVCQVAAYDVDTGKKLWAKPAKFEREPSGSFEMEFSPDGSRLVVTNEINRPLVFNGETGDELPRLEHAEHLTPSLNGGSFSGDGRLLAMSGARAIATALEGRVGGLRTTYSSAGSFLHVWDTETGKLLKAWDRAATVSFHPSKPILAILEPNGQNQTRLGLWDFSADTGGKK